MEKLYADSEIYQSVAVQFFESRLPIHAPVPGHQKWIELDYILRNKPFWTWVLAWFFTFGPLVQVGSSRILWPVPVGVDRATRASDLEAGWSAIPAIADKFLVIDNYYSNLWSFFGSRPVHAATLAFDLALTLGIVRAINRVQYRRAPA